MKHKIKLFYIIISIVFIVILFLPMTQMGFRYYREPANIENRNIHEIKQLSGYTVDEIHQFLKDFELWHNDHFGFRNLFIRENALINYHVFRSSPKSFVTVGRDGWLYYETINDARGIYEYLGINNFTDSQIDTIKSRLLRFKKNMEKRNIPILFVFLPNKHTIYPEYLPYNFHFKSNLETRNIQIDRIFKEVNIPYINLKQPLEQAKKDFPYPIYYKTDSHWNALGAYVGYKNIMNEVSKLIPITSIHTLSDFKIKKQATNGNGDLANYIFMGGKLNDTEIELLPKFKTKSRYSNEKINEISVIYKNQDTSLNKMLMFHDSFSTTLRPTLSENFSRSVFIWTTNADLNLIDKEKPDIFIFEFVERYSDLLLRL